MRRQTGLVKRVAKFRPKSMPRGLENQSAIGFLQLLGESEFHGMCNNFEIVGKHLSIANAKFRFTCLVMDAEKKKAQVLSFGTIYLPLAECPRKGRAKLRREGSGNEQGRQQISFQVFF